MAGRAELQRRLATEFEREGWPYERGVAPAVLGHIERTGPADGASLVARVPSGFLQAHGITDERMAAALDRALGGESIDPAAPSSVTVNHTDNRYAVQVSGGGSVVNSPINTAGTKWTSPGSADRG